MTMLRHSRDITRFQRSRVIKKRKDKFKKVFTHPEFLDDIPGNWFSKHHFTDCSCLCCVGPRYRRPKFDWRRALDDQDYAYLERKIIQNGWL